MTWLTLLIFALATAGLSHFVALCLEPGMILGRYGLLIEYVWRRSWRRKDRWMRFMLKPAGYCIYCTGTWLCIHAYVLYLPAPWYYLPLVLGLNYIGIELIFKLK